ncbi:MAG: TIGR02996 domain-containing protein [Proteobacteria bacterium]|nr:TIGR02996 domain-containing protein [Pseudomonadota bacterium]
MSTPKVPKVPKVPTANKRKALVAAPSAAQQQFLASILADPDDKKARLVYGDLLQDQGDPRGDFIVLQATRAELADTDERVPALDAQLAALLKKHKKAWTAFGDNKGARWEYRRGFVEKLSLDAADLLVNGPAIFAAEPIEELNIWKIQDSKVKLGASRLAPLLALPLHRVRRLSLARCTLTRDDFAALADADTLGGVELLDLSNGGSAESPIGALAAATSLPRLRELRIGGCMCGDEGLAELARAKALRFERLIAPRNDLTSGGAEAIANATWAPTLVHLDLSSNEQFGDAGLRALGASTKLTSLKTLRLDYVGLYEEAADIVLASPVFARLDVLDLSQGLLAADRDRIRAVFGDRLVA